MYDFLLTYSEVQRLIWPSPMGVVKALYYFVCILPMNRKCTASSCFPLESYPCPRCAFHQYLANEWPQRAFVDRLVSFEFLHVYFSLNSFAAVQGGFLPLAIWKLFLLVSLLDKSKCTLD